eukprot:EG_transcript_11251
MLATSAAALQPPPPLLPLPLLLLTLAGAATPGDWVFQKPVHDSYLAAFANSSFRSPAADLGFLRNASVVFIGDSVTRYQYMYLAQYLHHGRWHDAPKQQLCCEQHYHSFTNMYHAYLPLFGCSHMCDCADHHDVKIAVNNAKKHGKHQRLVHLFRGKMRNENHYFLHGPLQARLSFHFWDGAAIGMTAFNRTPAPADFARYCAGFPATAQAQLAGPLEPLHSYSVQEFVRDVLGPEGHDVLIFNYGIWKVLVNATTPVLSEANLDWLAEVAHDAAPAVVWKTTNAVHEHGRFDDDALLAGLQRRGFQIFDIYNLTLGVLPLKKAAMWDNFHFLPFVYRELNIALLEYLRDLLGDL